MRAVRDSVRRGLFMQRILDRLSRFGLVLNPYYLFLEGTVEGSPGRPELAEEYPTALLAPEDLTEIEAHSWASMEQLEDRVARGHLCVVGRHEGAIAGYTWADPSEINDDACDHPLGQGEAYVYDSFVVPDHRGRGLAPYLGRELRAHLQGSGFDTFYSIVDYFNSPSIRFKQKLGAVPVRFYLEIRLGKRRVVQWARDIRCEP